MIYAQVINKEVNLIGGEEVGLPLPKDYLDANPDVLNIEITNLEERPEIGDIYENEVFMPLKGRLIKNRLLKANAGTETETEQEENNEN